jgi:hypothetical protein
MRDSSVKREWSDKPKGKACAHIANLLRQIDPALQYERSFDWLFVPTTRERTDEEHKVFSALLDHCQTRRHRHHKKALCDPGKLLSDASIGGAARRIQVDFFLPSFNKAIEFDERQHFTEERRVSLECYPAVPLGFDRDRWIRLCSPMIQDSEPPCRDWTRAFRDAVRDIRLARHGSPLVRIYYRDFGASECTVPGVIDLLKKTIDSA